MVTKPTEKVWWICSSVQAGPSGPASALSKTQARVRVRAAALPLETIWSSCCRSSAARVMTYFLFMAEVPVRKDRFPPLYGSLPTFQYNLDKALDPLRGNGLPRRDGFCYLLQLARTLLGKTGEVSHARFGCQGRDHRTSARGAPQDEHRHHARPAPGATRHHHLARLRRHGQSRHRRTGWPRTPPDRHVAATLATRLSRPGPHRMYRRLPGRPPPRHRRTAQRRTPCGLPRHVQRGTAHPAVRP